MAAGSTIAIPGPGPGPGPGNKAKLADAEAATSVVSGDLAALGTIYDRHARDILTFSLRMLGNPSEANDCLRDVFVLAATRLDGLTEPAMLRSWLFAVARYICLGRLDNRRGAWSVDGQAVRVDDSDLVAKAQLPDRDRLLLELAERNALTGPDFAAAVGVSRSTAHTLLGRATAAAKKSVRPLAELAVIPMQELALEAELLRLRDPVLATAANARLALSYSPWSVQWSGGWPPKDAVFTRVNRRQRGLALVAVLLVLGGGSIAALLTAAGGSGPHEVASTHVLLGPSSSGASPSSYPAAPNHPAQSQPASRSAVTRASARPASSSAKASISATPTPAALPSRFSHSPTHRSVSIASASGIPSSTAPLLAPGSNSPTPTPRSPTPTGTGASTFGSPAPLVTETPTVAGNQPVLPSITYWTLTLRPAADDPAGPSGVSVMSPDSSNSDCGVGQSCSYAIPSGQVVTVQPANSQDVYADPSSCSGSTGACTFTVTQDVGVDFATQ